MSDLRIKKLQALEIIDSRGVPTLAVTVVLSDGTAGSAQVPSGTSAGKHEAHELRDGDPLRYSGKGVLKAVRNVEQKIAPLVKKLPLDRLRRIDEAMIGIDASKDKSVLGANAILGVSMAVARAMANRNQKPLYKYLRQNYKLKTSPGFRMPAPMFNVLNGGQHANSGMDIQEYMFVPNTSTIAESVRIASAVFYKLKELLTARNLNTGVGLEGGFAPQLNGTKDALSLLSEACKQVGIRSEQTRFSLDVAASELYRSEPNPVYSFKRERANFTPDQLIAWYEELVREYPILSIEDGLEQEDWEGWAKLTSRLGAKIKIVGDDFTVTNTQRLAKAIESKSLNAIIIKPNQIGTVSETIDAVQLAKKSKISVIVSHRSGDTCDDFIADLAVAVNSDFIKSGSVSRGERVSKYNRLIAIEQETKK